jgi:hypothetical protein
MRNDEREKNRILKRHLSGRGNHAGCVALLPWACLLLFLCPVELRAQDTVDFSFKSLGLEDQSANIIGNAAYLEDFFEKLYCQKNSRDQKINIIHIGDSHIQADYMTSVVRRNFQTYFGNAGRGLIVPLRVAGTNEPVNFITRSNVKWTSKRCVHMADPLPVGIGGVTINSADHKASLHIDMNDLWHDYAFNSVTLFYHNDPSSYDFFLADTAGVHVARFGPRRSTENHLKVSLPAPTGSVVLKMTKTDSAQNHATIFGLNFENGNQGILYHAIGVNGAKYMHYNAAPWFAGQTPVLSPQLIIIALGTNESIEYPHIDRNFHLQIERLVTSLQKENPSAKFLLVTPPCAFRKTNKHNPGIALIREQILRYAVENGIAFYDMFKALGGEGGASAWKNAGLLRGDGVHFTKDGYEYQGNLLFSAFMKSYNDYVPLRHP